MKSMKIKSDIHAGMTYEECDAQRNYWKNMAKSGSCAAYYPPATYYPPSTYYPPATYYPPTTYPPAPTASGGYVNGVYYPDKSGTCG
jgi:hypothetical protein